jgi:hypothetical protein
MSNRQTCRTLGESRQHYSRFLTGSTNQKTREIWESLQSTRLMDIRTLGLVLVYRTGSLVHMIRGLRLSLFRRGLENLKQVLLTGLEDLNKSNPRDKTNLKRAYSSTGLEDYGESGRETMSLVVRYQNQLWTF